MIEKLQRIDRNVLEDSDFERHEKAAVMQIVLHLEKSDEGPLLTIDEDDLLIDSPTMYFAGIQRRFTPVNARQMVRENLMTDKEVARRQNAGKAIIRASKADMYADRLMVATYATDQCRSLYRHLSGEEIVKVSTDDTSESIHEWVGDYVTDLLRAGRETRLLRGAAMATITENIREKFDEGNLQSQLVLTGLAGMNSRKKMDLWLDSLQEDF
jgi:hypothetical protein